MACRMDGLYGKEEVVAFVAGELVNTDCYLGNTRKFIGETEIIALCILPIDEGNKSTLITNNNFG